MHLTYRVHIFVARDFQNVQRYFPYTALIDWFLKCRRRFLSVRQKLNYLYII
jgi:hypothetical protein